MWFGQTRSHTASLPPAATQSTRGDPDRARLQRVGVRRHRATSGRRRALIEDGP